MIELLDEMRREHRSLFQVLNCLDRQVRILQAGGHPDLDIITAVLAYFEEFLERHHHPKEDLVFARLEKRDPSSASVLGDLAKGHLELGDSRRAFASAVRAALEDGEFNRSAFIRLAWNFVEMQRSQVSMEEESFFPAAKRALAADDWIELAASFTECLDPLHGGPDEERYDYIRRDIIKWNADDFFDGGTI